MTLSRVSITVIGTDYAEGPTSPRPVPFQNGNIHPSAPTQEEAEDVANPPDGVWHAASRRMAALEASFWLWKPLPRSQLQATTISPTQRRPSFSQYQRPTRIRVLQFKVE